MLYDRVHSRQIADYGGVVNTMPKFTGFTVLFAMANLGLPARPVSSANRMVIRRRQGQLLNRRAGRHRADFRRGLHAVAGRLGVLPAPSATTT